MEVYVLAIDAQLAACLRLQLMQDGPAHCQDTLTGAIAKAARRQLGCNCRQLRSVRRQQGLQRQRHRGPKRR